MGCAGACAGNVAADDARYARGISDVGLRFILRELAMVRRRRISQYKKHDSISQYMKRKQLIFNNKIYLLYKT